MYLSILEFFNKLIQYFFTGLKLINPHHDLQDFSYKHVFTSRVKNSVDPSNPTLPRFPK